MKPDEKNSAESAEVRKATGNEAQSKQRRGVAAGGQVGEKCGKGAERIRKLSVSTPSALPAAPKTPRRARSLEHPPAKSRAKCTSEPTTLSGAGPCGNQPTHNTLERTCTMSETQLQTQAARVTHGFTLSQIDALNSISAKLRAMLVLVNCSGGLESLDELSEEVRGDYLVACADMACDLKDIISQSQAVGPMGAPG